MEETPLPKTKTARGGGSRCGVESEPLESNYKKDSLRKRCSKMDTSARL